MKVSIIIATFNSSKTLGKSLQSVLDQKIQDWECIVVDGKSTDHTVDIIERYHRLDKRFRYISEKDKGIFDALNKGINLALGDWIYVLGSDDILTQYGISDLLDGASAKDDVIYGYMRAAYKNSTRAIFPKKISFIKYGMPFCHQNAIVRRSTIMKDGLFDINFKVSADYDMMLRIYQNGGHFKYVKSEVAIVDQSGISGQLSLSKDMEVYHIAKKNKSNALPFFNFWLRVESFLLLAQLRDRILKRK